MSTDFIKEKRYIRGGQEETNHTKRYAIEGIDMEQIGVLEAARRKKCSAQAVRDAIKKGLLDAVMIGGTYIVMTTSKFEEWGPSPNMQKGGRARWSTPKAKKSRKSA